tara:strand:+ start:39658 stop:40242 length:585 start_codon:yes stop_codon:yes gene_type:complete
MGGKSSKNNLGEHPEDAYRIHLPHPFMAEFACLNYFKIDCMSYTAYRKFVELYFRSYENMDHILIPPKLQEIAQYTIDTLEESDEGYEFLRLLAVESELNHREFVSLMTIPFIRLINNEGPLWSRGNRKYQHNRDCVDRIGGNVNGEDSVLASRIAKHETYWMAISDPYITSKSEVEIWKTILQPQLNANGFAF